MKDTPNFAAWNLDTLAKFAADAYVRMQEQEEVIAHYKLDLKDAMKIIRLMIEERDRHGR
jgi:hypothetical protein